MQRRTLFLLLLGGLLAATGCGSKPELVPVRGRILLEGQPVREFIVTFTPIGETQGNGAIGHTDADGQFTLTDMRGSPGARVGEYKVSLYPGLTGPRTDDPSDVVAKGSGRGVPGIYIDVNQTPLRATVPPGGGTLELLLTKSGKGTTTKTAPLPPAG